MERPEGSEHDSLELDAMRLFFDTGHLVLSGDEGQKVSVTFTKHEDGVYEVSARERGRRLWGASSDVSAVDAYRNIPPQRRQQISARLKEIDAAVARKRNSGK